MKDEEKDDQINDFQKKRRFNERKLNKKGTKLKNKIK